MSKAIGDLPLDQDDVDWRLVDAEMFGGRESRIGLRVEILDVDGMVWHGIPIATGHPEHVGKQGTIVCEDEGIPVIELDDGNVVRGSECWWISVEEKEAVERKLGISREDG